MHIQACLRQASLELALSSDSARLDAELLLAHVLGQSRSYLYTWPELVLNTAQQQHFAQLLAQRQAGQPVAYLLGYREFWGMTLQVSPDTLIPRPDTERLVEIALAHVPHPAARILDLGTGSGAIALALAKELPQASILAVDNSPAALQMAQANAQHHQLHQVSFLVSEWCTALPTTARFDLILSNPPYIDPQDPHLNQGDLRFEPVSALIAGEQGLQDIRLLTQQSQRFLNPAGWLLIEHGYNQASATQALLHAQHYQHIQSWQDWGGRDRVSGGQKGSSPTE